MVMEDVDCCVHVSIVQFEVLLNMWNFGVEACREINVRRWTSSKCMRNAAASHLLSYSLPYFHYIHKPIYYSMQVLDQFYTTCSFIQIFFYKLNDNFATPF